MNNKYQYNIYEKISLFTFGTFLLALSFNLFFSPNNIVIGGLSGLSIIFRETIHLHESIFILTSSLLLLLLGYKLLGQKLTLNALIGSILFPLFVECSKFYATLIPVEGSKLLISIFGGLLYGFASGLILKTNFSVGGLQILAQIINKYFHISLGKATLIINTIVILTGSLFLGISAGLYALISLYIISTVIDKTLIGISSEKTFYIITTKEKELEQYLKENKLINYTRLSVKGGYTNKNKKMYLCTIPTKDYTILKEFIKNIDKDAFFLITDTFETKIPNTT